MKSNGPWNKGQQKKRLLNGFFWLRVYESAKDWQLVPTVMDFFMVSFDNGIRKYQYEFKKAAEKSLTFGHYQPSVAIDRRLHWSR